MKSFYYGKAHKGSGQAVRIYLLKMLAMTMNEGPQLHSSCIYRESRLFKYDLLCHIASGPRWPGPGMWRFPLDSPWQPLLEVVADCLSTCNFV